MEYNFHVNFLKEFQVKTDKLMFLQLILIYLRLLSARRFNDYLKINIYSRASNRK